MQVLQRLAAQGGEQGTIRVPAATMKAWFDAPIDPAIDRIQNSLDRARSNGAQMGCMLVVGGLASSAYFTVRLRDAFSHEVKDISYPSVLYQTVLTGERLSRRCPVDWSITCSPSSSSPCIFLVNDNAVVILLFRMTFPTPVYCTRPF